MNIFVEQDLAIKNLDLPFTEIFSMLPKYQMIDDSLTLEYKAGELIIMRQHINNAMESTLQGLRCAGDMLSIIGEDCGCDMTNGIGRLVSLTSNLLDALAKFKMDIDYSISVLSRIE